jgi:hypothetical protein
MRELSTGIVIFPFTEIEGSTHLWEAQPETRAAALAPHEGIVREANESYGGAVFKTADDAFCAAFATPLYRSVVRPRPLRSRIGCSPYRAPAPPHSMGELRCTSIGGHSPQRFQAPRGFATTSQHFSL